ncbi:MAG: hypothetical protein LBU73_07740 [Helicobacteraceae bacterium]|nr:hypothetical protein [Helicobacteraceae bacterium]
MEYQRIERIVVVGEREYQPSHIRRIVVMGQKRKPSPCGVSCFKTGCEGTGTYQTNIKKTTYRK